MEPLALIFTRNDGSISEVILFEGLDVRQAEFRVIHEDGRVFAPGSIATTLHDTFYNEARVAR